MDYQNKNVRIGEILINFGYITQEQLSVALSRQKEDKTKRLADILIELGFITEHQKLEALGRRLGIPLINLGNYVVNLEAVEKIPKATAARYKLLAIDASAGKVKVCINDPLNFFAIEEIRQLLKLPVELCLAELPQLEHAIEYYYSEIQAKQSATAANYSVSGEVQEEIRISSASDEAPVVRLLNSLLVRGFNTNASDIHIEPFEEKTVVRMRVDGMIVEFVTLSTSLHQPLIARIKILANLDIAEKRIPQDGHFRMKIDNLDLNLRVSVIPTVYGEKAVLRFLSTNTKIDNDGNFGMLPRNYAKMLNILQNPHGIVYMTGPTGSGKTTTLYMILEYLSNRQVNISTIEDPVERNLRKINQVQVSPQAGLTFEAGLRALLRQDPDVIMVGETRDNETAEISVRAAITGHLVLSTLHTNDAVSSIVRLEDMGVPRHMLASSLVGIVAQRLILKICSDCSYEYEPDAAVRAQLNGYTGKLRRGRGCHLCNNTGYRGRTAIHEILVIDRKMREMIVKGATVDEMIAYAVNVQKMETLRQCVIGYVMSGVTTVEELMKTTYSA